MTLALAAALVACGGGGGASGSPPPPPTPGSRLAVSGTKLLDPAGHEVWMRGFNWGRWDTAQAEDGVGNTSRGATAVRLPFRWYFSGPGSDIRKTSAPGHIDPAGLAQLDNTVRWATQAGLWVVLFAGSDLGAGDSDQNYWTNPALKKEFFETWAFLAKHYASTDHIAAFELLSEPHPKSPVTGDQIRAFYDEAIAAVRAVDPTTPLVVGGNDHYDIGELQAALTHADPQIVYAANFYLPTEYCKPERRGPANPDPIPYPGHYTDLNGNPQTIDAASLAATLAPALDFRTRNQVPIFIDQIGCEFIAPGVLDYTRDALALFRAQGVSWAFWTYREDNSGIGDHGLWFNDGSGWQLNTALDAVLREGLAP